VIYGNPMDSAGGDRADRSGVMGRLTGWSSHQLLVFGLIPQKYA
jgi:hypothetical protein